MLSGAQDSRSPERGVAVVASIAFAVLAGGLILAIMMSARASVDSSRARSDRSIATALANDAATALSAALSSGRMGEHNGFIPIRAALQKHADQVGGTVLDNSSAEIPADLRRVDEGRIPASARLTLRVPVEGERVGYWQVLSVATPAWGSTPGGRVTVYVRAWDRTTAGAQTQPAVFRLEFRPAWFADYQMIFDGRARFAAGVAVTGRIHSNGYASSFFDQYATMPAGVQIELDPSTSCSPTARISTARGGVSASGGCASRVRANTGERVNLLRVRDTAAVARDICALPPAERPTLQVVCLPPGDRTVTLTGTQLVVAGVGSLDARVTGTGPTDNYGAVLVVDGNLRLSGGTLAAGTRATVIAAGRVTSEDYGSNSAPSIVVTDPGAIGSGPGTSSAFGMVAEGDLIADEETACPLEIRGAITTMSGMVSLNPVWRVPVSTPGGRLCGSATPALRIRGSIVGHFPPAVRSSVNPVGYASRSYEYLPSLYHNPPPMYPTVGDWDVARTSQADLDCFGELAGAPTLDPTREGCR